MMESKSARDAAKFSSNESSSASCIAVGVLFIAVYVVMSVYVFCPSGSDYIIVTSIDASVTCIIVSLCVVIEASSAL